MQTQLAPSSAHWFSAPEMQLCPLQVSALVVQVPSLPGMTLDPRHTQSSPNSAQVVVPTSQEPPQTAGVVVVVGVAVVVVVVVPEHSLAVVTVKLKGNWSWMLRRCFLPSLP